jgi:hypothetical protein
MLQEYGGGTPSSLGIVHSTTGNKVYFGTDLKLEWESIFVRYTTASYYDAVDESSGKYTTERLLVLKKYYNVSTDGVESYVIEFHKNMNYPRLSELHFIDINSRRKLSQISDDLQELNNIQRSISKQKEIKPGYSFIIMRES